MKVPSRAASMAYSAQCCSRIGNIRGSAGDSMSASAPGGPGSASHGENAQIQPERFSNGPGLKRAPARSVRRVSIGDLRDVTQPALLEVRLQWIEKAFARLTPGTGRVSPHPEPGLHKRTEEPGPHRALMIAAIARADVSLITSHVARIARGHGSETDRSPEPRFHRLTHARGEPFVENGVREATCRQYL